jgi:hypothetical protein
VHNLSKHGQYANTSFVPTAVNQLTSPSAHIIILHPSMTFIPPSRESILAEADSFKSLGSKIRHVEKEITKE